MSVCPGCGRGALLAQPDDEPGLLFLAVEAATFDDAGVGQGGQVVQGVGAQLEVVLQGAKVVMRHLGGDFLERNMTYLTHTSGTAPLGVYYDDCT